MSIHNFLNQWLEAFNTERIADPGDAGSVEVTRAGYCAMVAAAAETRTLPAPTGVGQLLALTSAVATAVNTITVSLSPTTDTFDGTNNTAVFNANGETLILMGIALSATDIQWRIVENIGSVAMSAA